MKLPMIYRTSNTRTNLQQSCYNLPKILISINAYNLANPHAKKSRCKYINSGLGISEI